VHSTEPNPAPRRPGMSWLEGPLMQWKESAVHPISNLAGSKFDLLQLIDIDRDGDLDVITCEEWGNLGLICYKIRVRQFLFAVSQTFFTQVRQKLGAPSVSFEEYFPENRGALGDQSCCERSSTIPRFFLAITITARGYMWRRRIKNFPYENQPDEANHVPAHLYFFLFNYLERVTRILRATGRITCGVRASCSHFKTILRATAR